MSPLSGFVLNFFKPAGVTSGDCVYLVRRWFQVQKIGHGGTLDPFASGVLPLGIGSGTKHLSSFLLGNKIYQGTFRIGYRTDTLDCDGKILEIQTKKILNLSELQEKASQLIGSWEQVTPIFSARKIGGKRLFELARAGKAPLEKDLPRKKITLFRLELKQIDTSLFWFEVECSSGTYVRQLIQDLLAPFEIPATLETLIRTRVGRLDLENACRLSDFISDPKKELKGLWRVE